LFGRGWHASGEGAWSQAAAVDPTFVIRYGQNYNPEFRWFISMTNVGDPGTGPLIKHIISVWPRNNTILMPGNVQGANGLQIASDLVGE
jgi:hypothetical protein